MAGKTEREPLRGQLDLLVLSVLADQPKYGYSIQQRIREASGGMVDVKAGTLYPLLHQLEAEKMIKSRWENSTGRRRKWYELTAAGRRRLTQRARQWSQLADCLGRLLEPILEAKVEPTA